MSNLRSYIEAVGGMVKMVAEFPEGKKAIINFSDLEEIDEPPLKDTMEYLYNY